GCATSNLNRQNGTSHDRRHLLTGSLPHGRLDITRPIREARHIRKADIVGAVGSIAEPWIVGTVPERAGRCDRHALNHLWRSAGLPRYAPPQAVQSSSCDDATRAGKRLEDERVTGRLWKPCISADAT